MKKAIGVLALACLVGAAMPACAEWSVNAQVERFRWNEQVSPPPEVDESGGRAGVGLTWTQDKDFGLRLRYRGTFYAGSVRYKGQQLITHTPAQATSDYAGVVNEIHGLYRASAESWFQLVAGLGFDYWERTLPFSSQREDWAVAFARIGAETRTWLQ